MYLNTYLPVMSLPKAPVTTGGLCSIRYCKWEDVLIWPEIDPETGIMASSLQLKNGAVLYFAEAIDQGRSFEEQSKFSNAGPYFETSVKGSLRGSNASNMLSIQKMMYHQWVVIAEDRNGVTRLIGNRDSGAEFSCGYSSGTLNNVRKTEISFKWEHPLTAPIYTADAFQIIIGGIIITVGCITFVERFKVGAPGAPMSQGDLLYINSLIVNKKVFVLADGMGLPVDDGSGDIDWTGSIDRHIEKTLASNTINFVGGVLNDETIEIYAYT